MNKKHLHIKRIKTIKTNQYKFNKWFLESDWTEKYAVVFDYVRTVKILMNLTGMISWAEKKIFYLEPVT